MREIPFSPPDMTDCEAYGAIDVLRSGWITTGPRTKKIENEIAAYCGSERAVCLNSATAALELTLLVLGIGEGDEVITTAYTYTATASIVCHVGATLVLADTKKGTYEIDYEKLPNLITERTKAIITVDIGGVLCDYEKVFSVVESKKALFSPSNHIQESMGRICVLADSAHAFGAFGKIGRCGEIADFTVFSFHAVKNLTTAEGGAVVWKNIDGVSSADIYQTYQLLSLHGQTKDALEKSKSATWEYDIIYPAYKCNMTDITAAIGLCQLGRYAEILNRRHKIIAEYDKHFLPLGIECLSHKTDKSTSSGHLYMTRIPNISEKKRNEIINRLASVGIASNVHYKPLPMMTAYKNLGFDIKDFPESFMQYESEITLPLHTILSDEDVAYIIEHYCSIAKEYL